MFSTIISGAVYGIQSYLVHVEVDISQGLPCFIMVGSLGSEVRESGERVRIALKNSDIRLPPMHIAVNLSPADIKKEGTGFDLPIAAAILVSMGTIDKKETKNTVMLGELGLNGEIKPVRGVLPIVRTALNLGMERCFVPVENLKEASCIKGICSIGVASLKQVIAYLNKTGEGKEEQSCGKENGSIPTEGKHLDFKDVAGQEAVKRAALIAAAGFHNLLLIGPPGSGKTMIAKRISTILPPLSEEESMEVSSVYSISGKFNSSSGLITKRPFMNPHHTLSEQALTGGGRIPRPGIISLAHRGILFLDEMTEFKQKTLDALRQPLEDKVVHIARNYGTVSYPADFMLVGSCNPCPCGYYPDLNRCSCTPAEQHRYISHISGPVLDRIDLCAEVPPVDIFKLQSADPALPSVTSALMKEKVLKARERQEKRYTNTEFVNNAGLSADGIERFCQLGEKEKKMLETVFRVMNLSARAYHKIIKAARTIADLDDSDKIKEEHLAEAVCYRTGEMINGKREF